MPTPRNAVPIAGLLLLSLLWALGVLRVELLPTLQPFSLPSMARQTIPLALLAILTTFITIARRQQPHRSTLRTPALIGLALFVAPEWLASPADNRLPDATRIVLLTLVPIFALVFEPYIGNPSNEAPRPGTLLAALTAVAGALCVFPAAMPQSIDAAIGFLAMIVAAAAIAAANCWAIQQIRSSPLSSISFIAAASTTAAIGTAFSSLLFEGPTILKQALAATSFTPQLLWSAAIELPSLLLLFWLMTRLSAIQLATRFLASPMLAVAGGLLLIHAKPVPRTTAGLLIIAAATAYLLLPHPSEPESSTLSLS
jgi:drug/metabolite transporter (DMT)-like permease